MLKVLSTIAVPESIGLNGNEMNGEFSGSFWVCESASKQSVTQYNRLGFYSNRTSLMDGWLVGVSELAKYFDSGFRELYQFVLLKELENHETHKRH